MSDEKPEKTAIWPLKTANCRSCGAPIVWMITGNNKNIPINAESVDESALEWFPPSTTRREAQPAFRYGEHSVHFETCPNADSHRKSRGKTDG